jgi:hypothetical protein
MIIMATKILAVIGVSLILAASSNPLFSLLSSSLTNNIPDVAGQEEKVNGTSVGLEFSQRSVWDEVIRTTGRPQ